MLRTNLAIETDACPVGDKPAWHNHLPGWIRPTGDYHSFKVALRHTLQQLANAGDVTPAGDIINIRGGARLRKRIGISRRTFQRYVARLIQAGFLVVLEQGGPLPGSNAANVYAIPGRPGAFDPDFTSGPGLWPRGVVSKRTQGGVKLTLPWRQNDAPPSLGLIPLPSEDHGVAVRRGGTRQPGSEATRQRACLLYTSPSPRDRTRSRMPSSA